MKSVINVFIICSSLKGVEDFVLWGSGFLSKKLRLNEVRFNFVSVGKNVEEFASTVFDLDGLRNAVSNAFPECGCPDVATFYLTGCADNSRYADSAYTLMRSALDSPLSVFVDLSNDVQKMVEISSCLKDMLPCGISCLTWYLSEELASMCQKLPTDDSLCCSFSDRFFCARSLSNQG